MAPHNQDGNEEEKIVLITGSSSGLGHAFTTYFAAQPHTTVFALDVTPFPSTPPQNVHFVPVDVTDETALEDFTRRILRDRPVHLLIHSAGVRGLVPSALAAHDVAAAETLSVMDRATFTRTFEINTWGAFATIRALVPSLKRAVGRKDAAPPKVIVMSSRMGSVGANTAGGGYAYRASKAALNAVVKSLSVDVPDVVVLAMHPGRVETGLVEWKEEGAMSAGESLETCLGVIEGVGLADSGKLLDRFGEVIPW